MNRRTATILLLGLLWPLLAAAGLQDFKIIEAAQKAYEAGQYDKSAALLRKLEKDDAPLHYDLGNAYYKKKDYDKALLQYKRAKGEGVDEHARLHNIGNVYFKKKQLKKAIKAYEAALKVADDAETRYNLELAKKLLKQQQEKKKRQQQKQQQKKQQQKKNQQKKNQKQQQKQKQDQKKQQKQQKKEGQKKQEQKKNQSGKQNQKHKEHHLKSSHDSSLNDLLHSLPPTLTSQIDVFLSYTNPCDLDV